MSLRRLGERGLIQRIRLDSERVPAAGVTVGIGDDAAVLAVTPGSALLATTDLVIEDVHFRRAWASPEDIGWKAMAVNLSDIAAMGGVPRWALIGLAVPEDTDAEDVAGFYRGLHAAAAPHRVALVGGDTSRSLAGWLINVTLLGEHAGAPRLRSAAQPGDAIAVTGGLGRAAAGLAVLERGVAEARRRGLAEDAIEALTLAHLRPQARVAEGQWLGRAPGVRAMMDCSDGLATDLAHICRESRVSARIQVERIPLGTGVVAAANALGCDALAWGTGGGEYYELLITCDPDEAASLARELPRNTGTPLHVIGEIEAAGEGIRWLGPEGRAMTLGAGFEHFRD